MEKNKERILDEIINKKVIVINVVDEDIYHDEDECPKLTLGEM